MYYVYQHRKADSNEIFYVGKGKGKRLTGLQGRNKYWKNTVNKHGFIAEIIKNNLDEEFALLIEMELIDTYRKRGINLVNLTNGGEGSSGHSHPVSEENKKKHSQFMIGNQYAKNCIIPEKTRKAVAEANKRRKGIPTGIATFAGKSHTEEHKKYIREKMKGRVFSEETRLKMSMAQKKRFAK